LQQLRVNNICETRRERATSHQDFPGPAAVKTQRPIASEEEHRVLQFRPRHSAPLAGWQRYQGRQPHQENARQEPQEPNDLSRYERVREEPDDFRPRMLANIAAVAFTVALMAVGLWLAKSIADLRRTQDCVLMGRRDCVQIVPPQS
jgi:hypothetical protein